MATQTAGVAHGNAREVMARLQAADAILQELTAVDAGVAGQSLHARVRASDIFSAVALVPWPTSVEAGVAPEVQRSMIMPLRANDLLALSSGQSIIKLLSGDQIGVHLAHQVLVDGHKELGFFKVAPAWLWQGVDGNPADSAQPLAIAVVDIGGRVLHAPPDMPQAFINLFVHGTQDRGDAQHPVVHHWQYDGKPWQASIVHLNDGSSHVTTVPWNLVVYGIYRPGLSPVNPFAYPSVDLLLLACLFGAALATLYLRRRWMPVLLRLHSGLAGLRAGELQTVASEGSGDFPLALAEAYNVTLESLSRRMRAQTCLAQIDRLLLEAPQLEQSIEPILEQVRALMAAKVVAVLLLDSDAPGHARIFIEGSDGDSAVWRTAFDAEAMAAIQKAPAGVALPENAAEIGNILEPLRNRGGREFYAWPVVVDDALIAVLISGFERAPASEAHGYGAQCGDRLRVALSKERHGAHLYRQAHFDSLTGLPNRVLFRDRLSQELATADGTQRGALLYVDLDHFKKVNDTVGHIAGDQLLVTVGQRLRACVKEGDTVARLAGDEFTVILRNLRSVDAAREIAERIIESLQRPVNLAGRDHHVRASIGVTLFPDDGNGIEELMRNADLAMYQAKDGGRSRVVFFDSKMGRAQTPAAQSGLFRALRRREFVLHYQPQFTLHTNDLVAVEALMRWHNPREGLRLPTDFVPAAEQSGLIVEIGAWALENACQQFAQWRDRGIAPARFALNLSVHQLRMSDFVALVRSTLERYELSPRTLELEITESVFADDEARTGLRALAALGIRLALDDFGTGYSSLSYLRAHPVDVIKIDRSFMHEVPESAQAVTLAATIIDMAHALGKQVVAEGVETVRQLDFLRTRGCDIAQGHALGRPVSVPEMSELLAARRATVLLDDVG